MVKRDKIRSSPKVKRSPMVKSKYPTPKTGKILGRNKLKISPKNQKMDEKKDFDGPIKALNKGKISKIVASFEENIEKKEADTSNSVAKAKEEKTKIVNAFSKLMESSKGRIISPSPGKKRKKKIGSEKPLRNESISSWLRREK